MIIIIIIVIMLLCYYFRLDTGFTILRNVHVLWVRAPLSKQYLKPHFSFDFPKQRDRHLPVSSPTEFFVFTSPAPSRRTAITLRF